MMLWIMMLVLTAAAVAFALAPLMARRAGGDPLAAALAFYHARRMELERQRDAGEIGPDEFAAAGAEQARRLLAAERTLTAKGADPDIVRRRKQAALGAMLGIPALALATYLTLGAPQRPDLPLAARPTAPQNLDIAGALHRIEAHLQKNPNDGRGFEVVAPVYLRLGRAADAVHAYRRVIDLLGESPARLADLGESLVAVGNGIVSAEARQAFERALVLDPGFAKARFYIALLREQDGDRAGALGDLRALAAGMPEGPARLRVEEEIARLAAIAGEPGAAIAALPPEAQREAIRSMV
ncbi:MAG: c-type cytochrome biogenesis protein CcmI, partial [Rhabdaerophilum calidifontis]